MSLTNAEARKLAEAIIESMWSQRLREQGVALAQWVLARFGQEDEGRAADKFPIGSRVRKIKGYKFEGRVLGSFDYFDKPDGTPPMVNVQHDDGWVMHFRENELDAI